MDDRSPRGGRPRPRSRRAVTLGGGGDLLASFLSAFEGASARVVAHGQQAGVGDDGVRPHLGLDGAEDLLGDVGMLPQERSRVLLLLVRGARRYS